MTVPGPPLPLPRPRLRGWLHAAMVPVAVGAGAFLVTSVRPGDRVPAVVFAICLVGLYATSSLYHVPRWGTRARAVLARCDVAMIQIFIVGTFTPVAWHSIEGPWRLWTLLGAWGVGVVGAAIAASPLRAPRWLSVAGYVAVSWLLAAPLFLVIGALPWEGVGLLTLGGVLYILGGTVYARQRPDPFPRWFGFHEVFHVFVVAGSTAHYLAILRLI